MHAVLYVDIYSPMEAAAMNHQFYITHISHIVKRDSLPKLAAHFSEPQWYIWCHVGLLEGG